MHTDYIGLFNAQNKENLLKTEALFVAQRKQWSAGFAAHFQSICARIAKQQRESALPAISYIEYTMLYTNFAKRRYVAEVRVYGEDSYLDKNQCAVGEYDISFLFAYFDELWDRLLSARKRYCGTVKAREITSFMMQALPDTYSYLVSIARSAITGLVDESPFADIIKNGTFMVNVGGYMSNTEAVFTERKNKDAQELAKRFGERLEDEYTFEDYSRMDFSGCVFTDTEFRYSQFRHTHLNGASLEGSSLIGASFYKADMNDCCLNKSLIYEADFSYAKLRNAGFANARGRAGSPNEEEWLHVGFLPVCFRHADLTNACFTSANLKGADFSFAVLNGAGFGAANLTGADFTGAVLTDADFTDATMDEARFDAARKNDLPLSPEQLEAVMLI